MSIKSGGSSATTASGNSMPGASIIVPAGYCQIFSGYLDVVSPNYCDVQVTGILEII